MKTSSKLLIKNNTLYDVLKYSAQIVLPALATLYFALSQIWGFPNGAEVVGTIAAFDAFLGVLLGLSTSAYNNSGAKFDGTIDVFEDEATKQFTLNMDGDPYELEKKDEVIFRVNPVNKDS